MSTKFVYSLDDQIKSFLSRKTTYVTIQLHIEFLIFKLIGSQKEWESDINLTYPSFRTTGPCTLCIMRHIDAKNAGFPVSERNQIFLFPTDLN